MPSTATRESRIWDRLWRSGDGISADYPLELLPLKRLEGKSVLEVGCGIIRYSVASRVEGINYTGLDLSGAALRIAADDGSPGVRNLVRGDARRLPFADGSYDFVIAMEMLHVLGAGIFRAIEEMARVSKEEIIFTAQSAEETLRNNGMEKMLDEEYGVMGKVRGLDVIAVTEPSIRATLRAAGLEVSVMEAFTDEEINRMHEPGYAPTYVKNAPKTRFYVEARKKHSK